MQPPREDAGKHATCFTSAVCALATEAVALGALVRRDAGLSQTRAAERVGEQTRDALNVLMTAQAQGHEEQLLTAAWAMTSAAVAVQLAKEALQEAADARQTVRTSVSAGARLTGPAT